MRGQLSLFGDERPMATETPENRRLRLARERRCRRRQRANAGINAAVWAEAERQEPTR